jgi:phosphoglucosamine mutase
MEKLFGTDGIRGTAGEFPLDHSTVRTIGHSLARQCGARLGRTPRFVTGRDTRESGAWIETEFHAGARSAGAECESAGVITTPGVAFVTGKFSFDAGVVISASHNPYEDNGIKIFSPNGKKIGEGVETAIEDDIRSSPESDERGIQVYSEDHRAPEFQEAYLDHLARESGELKLNGLKMAIDCANGAASHLAPELFRRLGAEVVAFNDQPDGRNINKDCGSLHLDALCAKVLELKADFGVAFDGDADRALFVDEKGNVVDGDSTLWIMAQFMRERGALANKTVVATVMSNIGLEIALASIGLKLIRAAVGDKYVLEELMRSNSELGGEQSGHVIFPRESLVGDGMMTTLFVLEAVRARNKPFSEMTAGFTRYPQILVNVKVREKQPFESVQTISQASRQIEDTLDGNGRLLLRYSGTENLARVMIEGKDQTEIEQQANHLAAVIKSALG